MAEVNTGIDPVGTRRFPAGADDAEGRVSAVSWAAIFAGAAGAAALSMLLLILGTGLGFSAVSPWTTEGISASAFGFATIAWLTFTQLAASGTGGYLAGRLRSKWTAVRTGEAFFRDFAHGFLTWSVASLLTALLVTSVVGSIISGGVRAGAAVAGQAASAVGTVAGTAGSAASMVAGQAGSDEVSNTIQYFVDSLFRDDSAGSSPEAGPADNAQRSGEEGAAQQAEEAPPMAAQAREVASEVADIPADEIMRIFARALRTGSMPQEDERFIGRLIAERTDLSQEEAEQRVSEGFDEVRTTLDETETMAREAADQAREASAYAAFWMFVALLIGAFAASFMAVFGGRQRDD